ncbi:hypothetical protein RAC89_27450 [Paenibacillus sp. GD4]|uniref:hypothetical protein n=1 Tax=Paenibacillus sp. GD4 TaxID=3068890 RepID=UPI002796D4EA|nr:hypothetical protein [Paenibacillus sp. GD4]MDQ1914136.1 hypothetical protein [Paenibacillus sp. GD4]
MVTIYHYGGIMFEFQTVLRKPPKLMELEYGPNVPEYQDFFIDINDAEKMKALVEQGGVDPMYAPMKIMIEYGGASIVDYSKPPAGGGGLWLDYLRCIEQLIGNQKARTLYGTDYFTMSMESINCSEVKFTVYLDPTNEEVISIILPKKAFILALLKELKKIWHIFDLHHVFSRMPDKTFRDETIHRIERCETFFRS